eukprot:TRINITY_DN50707_c0_g1_i1.p1 TRINITY_DN50707_c0_g1~~TRINITY_DN50707_c0_g1_i1.p1  ORF type:complete len:275 (+),score=37.07 TRINITY_DN50707_c0_g1_i1:113-937(+)
MMANVQLSRDEAAKKIQGSVRLRQTRKRLKQQTNRHATPHVINRVRGMPSDRQLIAQRALQHDAMDDVLTQSSFDLRHDHRGPPKKIPNAAPTPSPKGMTSPMAFNKISDQMLAFTMLDEQKLGLLNREKARKWLRCMGWCLTNEELDEMLDESIGMKGVRRSASTAAQEVWAISHLVNVQKAHEKSDNSSVESLQTALRILANNRARISRARLVEVTLAKSPFLGSHDPNLKAIFDVVGIGVGNTDCDDLALKIMERIVKPPSLLERYELKTV